MYYIPFHPQIGCWNWGSYEARKIYHTPKPAYSRGRMRVTSLLSLPVPGMRVTSLLSVPVPGVRGLYTRRNGGMGFTLPLLLFTCFSLCSGSFTNAEWLCKTTTLTYSRRLLHVLRHASSFCPN
ncbi:hypothetical protein KP79_PYT14711 [Mizuhopecten yessoensis]|uniref:Uncharacterized protein n=1 Tax=Mizuhopecten yessoensis TaxID=6573 RepID=A0A210R443_MIZYE|nr:hypothetical protein KP79_PYT14711 [Mizuhopecten yessoensis]